VQHCPLKSYFSLILPLIELLGAGEAKIFCSTLLGAGEAKIFCSTASYYLCEREEEERNMTQVNNIAQENGRQEPKPDESMPKRAFVL
jgi:hypothetical protein